MSEPAKNPFDILLDQIRAVVREEIAAALSERKPAKLTFNTKEAAAMLNIPESWLAAKARERKVPFRQAGHYRNFSLQDINAIMEQLAVNGELTAQTACDMTTASHKGGAGSDKEKEKRGQGIPGRDRPPGRQG